MARYSTLGAGNWSWPGVYISGIACVCVVTNRSCGAGSPDADVEIGNMLSTSTSSLKTANAGISFTSLQTAVSAQEDRRHD